MNIKEIIQVRDKVTKLKCLLQIKIQMPVTLQVNLDKIPVCLSALVTAGGIPELVPALGP